MDFRLLMTLQVAVVGAQKIGAVPLGVRAVGRIGGGSFEGPRLRGKVLPGGADWTVKRSDGVMELDLRVTLETDDGALVYLTFVGVRDDGAPEAPRLRTTSRFETADARYAFLNRLLAVGKGEIRAGGPEHVLEEVL